MSKGPSVEKVLLSQIEDISSMVHHLEDTTYKNILIEYSKVARNPEERRKFMEDMKHMKTMPLEFIPISDEHLKELNIHKVDETSKRRIEFIPEEGYCIGSYVKVHRGYAKVTLDLFINICWSSNVNNAKTKMLHSCKHDHHHTDDLEGKHHHHHHDHDNTIKDRTGTKNPDEHHWDIPYIINRAFKDNEMKIYDIVIGSKTYRRSLKDCHFRSLVIKMAIETIEEKYDDEISKDKVFILQGLAYKKHISSLSSTTYSRPKITPEEINESIIALSTNPDLYPIPLNAKQVLTNNQRSILAPQITLTIPNLTSTPMIEACIQQVFDDKLKLNIPVCRLKQSRDFITIYIDTVNVDPSSIKICLEHEHNDHPYIECTYMNDQYESFGLYCTFPKSIDPILSYATFDIKRKNIVIVIAKEMTEIWNMPIREIQSSERT